MAGSQSLPRLRKGDPLTARFQNDQSDVIDAVAEVVIPPQKVRAGRELQETQPESTAAFESFTLVSVSSNTVTATSKSTGFRAIVAKPYKLRGDATSRTVSGEAQVIVPAYVVGDIIFAARNIAGGTGIFGVNLQDINADGRAWAEDA